MKQDDRQPLKSELEALIVDNREGEIDRALRQVLEGRVAFEREGGRVLVRSGLYDLPQQQRLLVLLLARHAATRLGLPRAQLAVELATLAEEAQIGIKSCREYLSRLKARRIVQKTTTGYELPAWNIMALAGDLVKTP